MSVKVRPHVRVIRAFGMYSVGTILTETTAVWRDLMMAQGFIELVKPATVGGLTPVQSVKPEPPLRQRRKATPLEESCDKQS